MTVLGSKDDVRKEARPSLAHVNERAPRGDDMLRRLDALLGRPCDRRGPVPANGNVEDDLVVAARRHMQARRERERIFTGAVATQPAWDILVQLFIAGEEGRGVSAFAIAAALVVPEATILRSIAHLVSAGLVLRRRSGSEERSIYLVLSESGKEKMCDYFTRAGAD